MLGSIFLWIYRLDYYQVLLLLAVCTGLFYAVYRKLYGCRPWLPMVLGLLFIWAAAVVAQTILQRTPDSAPVLILTPFQSYWDAWKEGGQPELLRSNFMNAVLFYPFGLLLASILPPKWAPAAQMLLAIGISILFTTVIEFVQYRGCLGLAQTDDVIHAALGALAGSSVMCLLPQSNNRCS